MRFKTAKVSAFRLWGLMLMLIGMGFMIAGTAAIVFTFPGAKLITGIGLVLGLITMLGSMGVYFWAGMLSTSAVQLYCPECGEMTKMLGKTDRCMHCRTILTLDRSQATQQQETTTP